MEKKQSQIIKFSALVDPEHELKAMTNYVTNNWDGFDKVNAEELFKHIWETCLDKTKNVFDNYAFTDLVQLWDEERRDYNNWKNAGTSMSKKEFDEKIYEDVVKQIPIEIMLKTTELHRTIRDDWDYEKVAKSITNQIKNHFPESDKLKPNGWDKFKKNYSDYAGMDKFDSAKAKQEFGGMHSGIGCHPFEVRVALPYVMYDDINQSRKPLEVLVGAVLTHAYVMNERNNASLMLREMLKLKAKYDQPEYYKEPVKEVNFDFQVPLNKMLFTMINQSNPSILKEYGEQRIEAKRQKHLKKSNKP
jgi:hypothetical protein